MQTAQAPDSIPRMTDEASKVRRLEASIVLHRSDLGALRDTLESFHRSALQVLASQRLEAIALHLVDNASGDAYLAELRSLLDASDLTAEATTPISLTLHCLERNAGFGAGHNAALAGSEADLLLILNPDVELASNALEAAVACLDAEPRTVAINPSSERGNGEREYLCKRYPSVFDLLLRGFGRAALRARFSRRLARYEYRDRTEDCPDEVEILSGACLLCRSAAFAAVGGFDERFFLYFEDFDLSRRLAAHGQLRFCPQMKIVHHGGHAARKGLQHITWFTRSALRFFLIHGWKLR